MEKVSGLKRDTIDKFYTNIDIVELCMKNITKILNINKQTDIIIEPSAGEGVFIKFLKNICENILCYDIEPSYKYYDEKTIITQDFLELDLSKIKKK